MTYRQKNRYEVTVGGKLIVFETGDLAKLAGGAVSVTMGESVLLATATMSKSIREGIDFFPLSVDFEERMYAAGRIPGSFFRREGRPTTDAILTSRLIDRPLRPLFPKGFRNDVQIICTALSTDEENQLDILAINAASAALMISDIPFDGPIAGVRVGYAEDRFVVNPTFAEMENSLLDLRLAGTADGILMVEAGANELPENLMLEAMRFGHEAMQPITRIAESICRPKSANPRPEVVVPTLPTGLEEAVSARAAAPIRAIIGDALGKEDRSAALSELSASVVEELSEQFAASDISAVFDGLIKQAVRGRVLDTGDRPDGRRPNEIRPISAAVGVLPRTHGTGLFTRGETQVLTIATLGTPRDAQTLDSLSPEDTKRYMHHYNFPAFSTGEVWPNRGPKRREIGHGALAERALEPVIPDQSVFPYTLRLVSECLASNGSTSMASVCGSTLSLMDAGVPISAPVAGIAMGLISEGDVRSRTADTSCSRTSRAWKTTWATWTSRSPARAHGITALQMDIKINGLSYELLGNALSQAHEGALAHPGQDAGSPARIPTQPL